MNFNLLRHKPSIGHQYYYYFHLDNSGMGKLVGHFSSGMEALMAMHNRLEGYPQLVIIDDDFRKDAWQVLVSGKPNLNGHTVRLISYHTIMVGD